MIPKIVRWVICGVVGSSAPIIINYVLTAPNLPSFSPLHVVEHGELCIVVAAMCSVSAGELFGIASERETFAVVAGGFTLLLLVISTALYVYVPVAKDLPGTYIGRMSYILFGLAFVSSTCCIGLSVGR